MDSSNALLLRMNGNWNEVYQKIPLFFVYPGIYELINLLNDKQVPLCVVTSSPRSYCLHVLDYWKLDIPFQACYHDTVKHKPHPEPILTAIERIGGRASRVISVGDDAMDTAAAKEAGAVSVGALWGSLYRKKLIESNPNKVFDEVGELKTFLTKYI